MASNLRHAAGSLIVVGLAGTELSSLERAWLKLVRPGGIILFRRNIADAAQTRTLLSEATAYCAPHSLRCVDLEGGTVDRLRDALAPTPAAQFVARANLHGFSNLTFHECSVGDIPLPDGSLDFVFSLGVLHHVPDTEGAVRAIAAKLKPGAPFLLYLYYALDNRPAWYRTLWKVSDFFRVVVSRQPHPVRLAVSGLFAALVYWPLARAAALLSAADVSTAALPLVYYSDKSFYVMRTDAYDRFCTRLEKRFTRAEIERMMRGAGLEQIRFSDSAPYWCAVGIAAPRDA